MNASTSVAIGLRSAAVILESSMAREIWPARLSAVCQSESCCVKHAVRELLPSLRLRVMRAEQTSTGRLAKMIAERPPMTDRATALLICGSRNQTTQLHAVARAMADVRAVFTPFYGTRFVSALRRIGVIENTIGGHRSRARCVEYLRDN